MRRERALGIRSLTWIAALSLATTAHAQDILRVHEPGPGGNPYGFGIQADFVGDTDADGVEDYAVVMNDSTVWSVTLYSGATGSVLHHWPLFPLVAIDALAGVGDINGDGHDDVAVGLSRFTLAGGPHEAGAVGVFSGNTGALLFAVAGTNPNEHLHTVAGIGDVDGDGVPDLAVGAPAHAGPAGAAAGRVIVYTMATRTVLFEVPGPAAGKFFGTEIVGIGDWDGDTVPDFAVGSPGGGLFLNPPSQADVISGATQTVLATFPGTIFWGLGTAVANVGDLNGDGKDDLGLGGPRESNLIGRYEIRAGGTGTLLASGEGTHGTNFGYRITGGGDADGDGTPDYIVGAEFLAGFGIYPDAQFGSFRLYSGATTKQLAYWRAENQLDQFAYRIAGPSDLDGDGYADWLVSVPHHPGHNPLTGKVEIWRGGPRYFSPNQRSHLAYDDLILETRLGPPGTPVHLFITNIDTTPVAIPLSSGAFDAQGVHTWSWSIPPGLAGHTATVMSYSYSTSGTLVVTNPVAVALR